MAAANTLAYYEMASITTVKCFIVEAQYYETFYYRNFAMSKQASLPPPFTPTLFNYLQKKLLDGDP
jgi:hypothetical protein